jgi:hypothetical protein
MPIAALLDANIRPSTVTHNLEIVPKTGRWANAEVTLNVWTPVRRRLTGKTQVESEAIYSAFAELARMSINGDVTLCNSDETFFESLYLKLPILRGTPFDALRGVKPKLVRGPLRRTYVIGAGYSRHEANDQWLHVLREIRDPRFLEMKKGRAEKHLADLYHLWTAEENSLDYFITLDCKFINAVTLPWPLETPVKVCTPMQFVESFHPVDRSTT